MKLARLKEFDKNLSIEFGENFSEEILRISSWDYFQEQSLVMAKNVKFLRNILENFTEEQKKVTPLVLEKKFWEKSSSSYFQELKNDFPCLLLVESIELFLLNLSQEIYEIKKRESEEKETLIHPDAVIHDGAKIGRGVSLARGVEIMSGAVVMDGAEIDEGTLLFPNVTIYPMVKIGKNCRIHSGSVVGSDGFGYQFLNGKHHKIWHSGSVIIGNDVEVGATSAIDSGTFTPTLIGDGTKIDNHVQIGHNCRIGKHVILCGHVGISGSVKIGDYSVFGGFAGAGPGITIGKMTQAAGGALINCDWPDKSVIGGHPARPLNEWMRGIAYLRKASLFKGQKSESSK